MIFFLAMLFFISKNTQAQDSVSVNLQQLLDSATSLNPMILNEKLQVEVEKLRKKGSITMPKTDFLFQYGSINDAYFGDLIWQVSQNFPFPSLFAAQKDFAQRKTEAAEAMQKVRELEVKRNLRKAYFSWLFAIEKEKILMQQATLMEKLEKIAQVRHESGESDISEPTLISMQKEQLQNDLRNNHFEKSNFQRELQKWTFTEGNYKTAEILQKVAFEAQELNNPLVLFLQKNVEAAQMNVKIERRKALPNFQVGFFSPTFYGKSNLYQVFQAGISVPIFFSSFKSNIEVAKKNVIIAENTVNIQKNAFQRDLDAFLVKRKQIAENLANYESKQLPNAQKLIALSENRYKSGDTNFILVGEMRKQAFAIQLTHLQVLLDFNLTQADLMFLAGQ